MFSELTYLFLVFLFYISGKKSVVTARSAAATPLSKHSESLISKLTSNKKVQWIKINWKGSLGQKGLQKWEDKKSQKWIILKDLRLSFVLSSMQSSV